jgi:signal transduction histidine kinase
VHEPTPERYNPPLTWRSHAWRTALVLGISAALWPTTASAQWHKAHWLVWLDLGVGLVTLVLSFFRRRWPMTVAVVTTMASFVSATSNGPSALAAVSLATRRVLWQVVVIGVLAMAGAVAFPLYEPTNDDNPWWIDLSFGLAATAALLAWGMYVGSRRALLWTLRERAERAEAAQEEREGRARATERARIAREMHDVLAHRISLVSMHAGALAYRTDLSADEVRGTAELIQAQSHEALTDLRQVLGVLRGDQQGDAAEPPQPTFADLGALVGEAEASGMHVRYDETVLDARRMPEPVGRAAYRIVQEALTNARKHAPGATVLVDVSGSADEGVTIRVRNPAQSRNGSTAPGAGLGLVGLRERASLAGGRVQGGRNGGVYELDGWLPWTT